MARSLMSTEVHPRRSRNEAIVGAQPSSRSGINPMRVVSSRRTALTRRRTQRTALGSVISGPRNRSAADSTLEARSTLATTSSIACKLPGMRAAR
jgi:hypothetical protein